MRNKLLLLFSMLVMSVSFALADVPTIDVGETGSIVINLTTFAGLAALVSVVCTQVLKVIPFFSKSRFLKILSSVVIGIVVTFLGVVFGLATFLLDASTLYIILYGVLAGLSACGLYDVIKIVLYALGGKEN